MKDCGGMSNVTSDLGLSIHKLQGPKNENFDLKGNCMPLMVVMNE